MKPTLFINKNLGRQGLYSGLQETVLEVQRLSEPDVDLYAWITNEGNYAGIAYVGAACDSLKHRKTSLTRGPGRVNSVVETAEVKYILINGDIKYTF